MRLLDGVVGWVHDDVVASRLQELRHQHAVEYVHLDVYDLDRRRLRVTSDAGVVYAVALTGDTGLADGAVLLLEDDRAVVVRAGAPTRMTLRACDIGSALQLGFLAGHLHWKVDRDDDTLVVHLESAESDYTARIADLLDSGRVERVDD